MTPQRAQEIWNGRRPFGELPMSEAERLEVRKVWSGMPGHTCFADALLRIAHGEVDPAARIMVGTAIFRYGEEIVESAPVYWGEDPAGPVVAARARRSIEMLGMPATDPVHGCNARLYKFGHSQMKFYPCGT